MSQLKNRRTKITNLKKWEKKIVFQPILYKTLLYYFVWSLNIIRHIILFCIDLNNNIVNNKSFLLFNITTKYLSQND